MKQSRSLLTKLLAILLAFGLIAAACGGDDDDAPETNAGTDSATDGGGDGEEPEPDADDSGATDGDAEPEQTADQGDVETIEEDPEETATAGGTLRYGIEADVDGINPVTSALSQPGLTMANMVFDTLAAYDKDGVAVPFLAESFTPSDDFTSWTVKLRPGLTFHDGTPVDSTALEVNFVTVIADPLVGLAVAPFYPAPDEAFEIIDELTAQYNLLDPDRFFPASLTGQLGMLASPTWVQAALEDPTLNQQPVGTGPFMFDSRSEDSVTRFVRNDNYWNGEVYLDAVEFVPVTDPDIRNQLLFEGDINAVGTSNPTSAQELLDTDGLDTIKNELAEESFAMINSSVAPFDDIRAREALAWATPRDNYNLLINELIPQEASGQYTPQSKYFNPDVVQQADDPDKAVELAAAYCADVPDSCTDGKINMELQWSGPSVVQTRIADLLTEGWSVAFNVTPDELAQDQHIQQAAFGQYNVVTWRQFGAVEPSRDNVWLLCRTVGGISLNWPKYCDEERDALLLEAQSIDDEARRIEIYKEVSQKINEDFLYIFFNHTLWVNAFSDELNGVCDHTSPEGVELLCTISGRTWHAKTWISSN